jgi:hypothetical protein
MARIPIEILPIEALDPLEAWHSVGRLPETVPTSSSNERLASRFGRRPRVLSPDDGRSSGPRELPPWLLRTVVRFVRQRETSHEHRRDHEPPVRWALLTRVDSVPELQRRVAEIVAMPIDEPWMRQPTDASARVANAATCCCAPDGERRDGPVTPPRMQT